MFANNLNKLFSPNNADLTIAETFMQQKIIWLLNLLFAFFLPHMEHLKKITHDSNAKIQRKPIE